MQEKSLPWLCIRAETLLLRWGRINALCSMTYRLLSPLSKSLLIHVCTHAKNLRGRSLTSPAALTTAQFHPDGHLFAAGGKDGQIKLFDTKTGTNAANFDEDSPIEALHFSENGTWLAVVSKGSVTVSVWDLRKSSKIKELDMGGSVNALKWDYTGQFLATAGPSGLTVQAYDKGKKEWSEPLSTAVPATALDWGSKGRSLVTVNETGVVTVLGGK